ncbi:11046_t:CDS:2, partial [Entrophospora sp. SA101]
MVLLLPKFLIIFISIIALLITITVVSLLSLPKLGLIPEKKQLTGYFLHITDFHPDAYYEPNAIVKSRCHQRLSELKRPVYMKKGISGPWGAEATICDSPISLINATFEWLEKNWKNKLDFVIWTGDNSRHDNDNNIPRTPKEMYDSNRFITNKFLETFTKTTYTKKHHPLLKTIPIVPSIGNNDLNPNNIIPRGPNDILTNLHETWSQFIPKGQHQYFLRGGYFYTEVIPGKLIVVSLNTLYFYKSNTAVNGCKVRTQPGTIQFRWLNKVLKKARKHGLKVYLTGHIAPRRNQYILTCYKKYGKLAIKYHDLILDISLNNGIIKNSSGDSSILSHKSQTTNQLNFQSSQTNINDDENKQFHTKVYNVDNSPAHSNTFLTPLGYTQYFINLTEANQYPNITPEFKIEYTTWDDYNMKDLTVPSWIHLARKVANHGLKGSIWEKIREHLMVGARSIIEQRKSKCNHSRCISKAGHDFEIKVIEIRRETE